MKKILLAAAIIITTAIIIYAAAISHPRVQDECKQEWAQKEDIIPVH